MLGRSCTDPAAFGPYCLNIEPTLQCSFSAWGVNAPVPLDKWLDRNKDYRKKKKIEKLAFEETLPSRMYVHFVPFGPLPPWESENGARNLFEKARIDSVKRCELSAVVKIPTDIKATWPLVFIKGRLAPAMGNSKVLTGKSVSYENTDWEGFSPICPETVSLFYRKENKTTHQRLFFELQGFDDLIIYT